MVEGAARKQGMIAAGETPFVLHGLHAEGGPADA